MSEQATGAAPKLSFSHLGVTVLDLDRMEDFYSRVLGFTVTDRGEAAGMRIVFLSRDPRDHHQIVLATGRPSVMPDNTANPRFGPSINQISFRLDSLSDLRTMYERLRSVGINDMLVANHGVSWSIYLPDPEGNNIELFVDTDWYIDQPFLKPFDITRSDREIQEETLELCRAASGFEPISAWRERIGRRMRAGAA
jgi:catechol-2,3-dioxygenase